MHDFIKGLQFALTQCNDSLMVASKDTCNELELMVNKKYSE